MRATWLFRLPILLAALGMAPASAQEGAPTTGRAIASLARVRLISRTGQHITLGSRIAPGKPTLIAIWASWCAPCIAEASYLRQLRANLGDSFNFVYLNRREGIVDPDQPPEAIDDFLTRTGLTDVDYVAGDVKAYRQIVGADLKTIPQGLVGIPRVYLFDSGGRQIYTSFGFSPSESAGLEQRIKRAADK